MHKGAQYHHRVQYAWRIENLDDRHVFSSLHLQWLVDGRKQDEQPTKPRKREGGDMYQRTSEVSRTKPRTRNGACSNRWLKVVIGLSISLSINIVGRLGEKNIAASFVEIFGTSECRNTGYKGAQYHHRVKYAWRIENLDDRHVFSSLLVYRTV